jgi:hypothetical protein
MAILSTNAVVLLCKRPVSSEGNAGRIAEFRGAPVSVVSMAYGTVVRGNSPIPVAKCGVALGDRTTIKEFSRKLRPVTAGAAGAKPGPAAKPDAEPGSGELK